MSASSPSRTANLWETPQEYFIFLLRITAKRNWSPTVFPFLPPRETKCSPDPTPVRILTRSKMQNTPMGVCISDAPRVGFEPTTLSLTARCSTVELSGNRSKYIQGWYNFQYAECSGFRWSRSACNYYRRVVHRRESRRSSNDFRHYKFILHTYV